MSIKLSKDLGRSVLREALGIARSSALLPEEWARYAERVFAFDAGTYFPALGGVLLAKSMNADVDAFSIKSSYGPKAFSLRSITHEVLVPAAAEWDFSLRLTGREPLNNQPFFRYAHISEIDRVRSHSDLQQFRSILSNLQPLGLEDSRLALAAYLRYADSRMATSVLGAVDLSYVSSVRMYDELDEYTLSGGDVPKKAQALVAACMDMQYDRVLSRKVNDPSRDFPGDVQVFEPGGQAVMSVEVRTKSVSSTDVRIFSASCRRAGVGRAVMAAFGGLRIGEPLHALIDECEGRYNLHLRVITDVRFFIEESIFWADAQNQQISQWLLSRYALRLEEIEVGEDARSMWEEAIQNLSN